MRPQLYSFSQARARVSRLIEERRAQLPPTVRTRRKKRHDGTTFMEHYEVGGSLISDGAEKTLWALVRLAINATDQVLRVPMLALACDEQAADVLPTVPPIATNCEALCQARTRGKRVASRTVRNHLTELRTAGFITRQQWRGWQNDFYVWISPELVWKMPQNMVEKPASAVFQKAVETALQQACGTNFPPYEPQATEFYKEIEIGQVDKLVPHEATAEQTGHTSGYTGAQPKAESAGNAPKKASDGPAGPEKASGRGAAPAAATGQKKALTEWQTQIAQEFFVIAWRDLYYPRGLRFSEEQQDKALRAIINGVYSGFDERWQALAPYQQRRYHEQALERLGMAAAYFTRNPDKYPPLPWAEFVPGEGYFDAENARGFVKTLEWHEQHLRHRMERATAEGLRKARRAFTQHRLGKAPKRLQQKSTLDLYRYYEQQFRKLGQPALHRFKIHFDAPPVLAQA